MELGEEALVAKGINAPLVRNIFKRMKTNMHKLQMPPILKLGAEEVSEES